MKNVRDIYFSICGINNEDGYMILVEKNNGQDYIVYAKNDNDVIERIKKLENTGLIEKYTAIINQSALGRDLVAFISVRLEHPKYNEGFITKINENPSVSECHYIAGDFDFLIKVITKAK